MRLLGLVVVILGIATLVFGIMFFPQASDTKQKVVDSLIAPVTLENLDATYDQVNAAFGQMAQTDPLYIPTLAKRTSLGLGKTNVGISKILTTSGIINIIIGAGLAIGGCALMMKKGQSA
jgi:hypothetical protein